MDSFNKRYQELKSIFDNLYSYSKIETVLIWFLNIFIFVAILIFLFEGHLLLSFLYSLILLLIVFVPFFLKKLKINLPIEIIFIIDLFIFAALFLGEIQNFYEKYLWWDIVLHSFSGILLGVVGFLTIFILYDYSKFSAPYGLIAFFSGSFSIAIGVFWEIFEYSMDIFLGWNMQKSGLPDTMGDLILDSLGAVLVSILGYFYLKGYKVLFLRSFINFIIKKHNQKKSKELDK